MARSSSGVFVTGLTAAALAVVGYLAYEASAAPHRVHRSSASASATPGDAKGSGKDDKGKGGQRKDAPPAVPDGSGTGKRVVYSVGQKRVWLVPADAKGVRSFEVTPSTVNPQPGTYAVTSRDLNGPGSDGVRLEHIVRFLRDANGVVFGFSAAVDGSPPQPDPTKKTGGVREKPADGLAMWEFAPKGTKVVVVP
ncbi:hypothetical protein [Streptomyces sp. I05A-00742]|uniref:hypothetical protein n=1 Tax=Streptomyces sp. I05A-00742 TaxID=2732853 RepID=UPI001487C7B2|nr:hypothetical protein [Streptomyces sp. I05A-00742]